MSKRWKRAIAIAGTLAIAVALFTPERDVALAAPERNAAFTWGEDALWERLERDFESAKAAGCEEVAPRIAAGLSALDAELDAIENQGPEDPVFARTERALFAVAPLVAACPEPEAFIERIARLRRVVKDASAGWDVDARPARVTLYRLLYGSRAALEEILLQADDGPALMHGVGEPSQTPSVTVHGVTLHSGDVLLSRGGAPTSAFIARGNDYPGNFSHVALLHVAEDGTPTVIESHIESGLGTTSAERYLEDTKLRIAVLRMRADHPALAADPMLPHRAATDALRTAQASHVPYDFEMNYRDPSRVFCSEVASAAYAQHGVTLWRGLSSMSGEGLTRWLAAFGVRHFTTIAPSDLEYDPQMRVVAEWRDPDALFSDHLDNAVLDVMLEDAERGMDVGYDYLKLPVARVMKAYSVVLNLFGAVGPIPEGMSATTGLRVDWLRARHGAIREGLEREVAAYRRDHGRRPPYWELVELARSASRSVP